MKLEASITTAVIGLLGVLLGSFIQWVIARLSRVHERNLALELRRMDKRIEVYTELIRYVAQCEKQAGRTLGGTSHRAKQRMKSETRRTTSSRYLRLTWISGY